MAAKKPVITLEHSVYKTCTLQEAYFTASSGASYFRVLCAAGSKQLLADPEYWLNTPDEVAQAFAQLSTKSILAVKKKLAAEHAKDVRSTQQTFISADRRKRNSEMDQAESTAIETKYDFIADAVEQ